MNTLVLFETHNYKRSKQYEDIFKKHSCSYSRGIRFLKRENKKIVYRIYGYISNEDSLKIRNDIRKLEVPEVVVSNSLIFDTVR